MAEGLDCHALSFLKHQLAGNTLSQTQRRTLLWADLMNLHFGRYFDETRAGSRSVVERSLKL
jgi:hypothetical protein